MVIFPLRSFIELIRPHQYYKNLLIGVCIVFSGQLLNTELYLDLVLGFVMMSFVSSSGYIINDIVDREKDKIHPDKMDRPLPAGDISIFQAILGLIVLNIIVISGTFVTSLEFVIFIYLLLVSTIIYSFYAKYKQILDIIFVSINFIIRAVAGCILINEEISEWLFICGFLFALFLVVGKRYGDLQILGDKAVEHREVYKFYTKEVLTNILMITSAILIVSFAIYVIESPYNGLLLTFPVFVYFVLSYLQVVLTTDLGKKPHLILIKKNILGSLLLMALITIQAIYIDLSISDFT